MAITIGEIYKETKELYKLKLICGKKGLGNIMDWVYISESIYPSSYLNEGELVISTGYRNNETDNWLYSFITILIEHDASALILNTGDYLTENDITPEIIDLCNQHDFPLFTMPWEIHLYDITHDYYNRIFHDNQAGYETAVAFLDLIYQNPDTERSLALLRKNGYQSDDKYRICYLSYRINNSDKKSSGRISLLEHYLKTHCSSLCFAVENEAAFILIFKKNNNSDKLNSFTENQKAAEKISLMISEAAAAFSSIDITAGLSGIIENLVELPTGYYQAKSSAAIGGARGDAFCAFDDLGFFKLLLSISDRTILEEFVDEKLGAVLSYDKKHKSNYTETLYQYLIQNGSIQNIAEALFCHRNTINYRIHYIKESFGLNIDDAMVRFELMAAFQIKLYLEHFSTYQA